jgi:hypothetical protein
MGALPAAACPFVACAVLLLLAFALPRAQKHAEPVPLTLDGWLPHYCTLHRCFAALPLACVECVLLSQRMPTKRQLLCPVAIFVLPQVFKSRHADMPDLAVPDWAADADEFVALHR